LTLFATLILEAGTRSGAALLRGSFTELRATLRGYHLLWAALRQLDLCGRG
jgi:hypothetical protein